METKIELGKMVIAGQPLYGQLALTINLMRLMRLPPFLHSPSSV
jgi:hypothetical protein